MGLDITGYSKIVLIDELPDGEAWETKYYEAGMGDDTFYVYRGEWDFPDHMLGLVQGGVYRFDKSETGRMGYGTYSHFRSLLAQMALGVPSEAVWQNREQYKDAPFYALIDFTDSDGWVGTPYCKMIAADFQRYDERAKDTFGEWYGRYQTWMVAFTCAADNGAMHYH